MGRRVLAIAVLGALLCSLVTAQTTLPLAQTTAEQLIAAVKGSARLRAGTSGYIKTIFRKDCVSLAISLSSFFYTKTRGHG